MLLYADCDERVAFVWRNNREGPPLREKNRVRTARLEAVQLSPHSGRGGEGRGGEGRGLQPPKYA